MKAGTESRWKVILMVVLALVAVGTFVNMLVGWSGSPQTARASGTKTDTAYDQLFGSQQTRRNRRGPVVAQQSPDPTVRFDLLRAAEETRYEGSNRNIFRAEAEPPPIPTPVNSGSTGGSGAPPTPTVAPKPQIPLKF